MKKGKLHILPNLLDDALEASAFFPATVGEAVYRIQGLIAESEKAARRYLRRFISREALDGIALRVLSEHTKKEEIASLLEPVILGENWGLISDSGLACIADPGADLVSLAHQRGIDVETFVGPCSIVMALQLSGFSGQNFSFCGYLPRETSDLEMHIKELEKKSDTATQIWIEAPYRSNKMLDCLKRVLNSTTFLCVASNLTTPSQKVVSLSINDWRQSSWVLEKEPVIFLISRRFS